MNKHVVEPEELQAYLDRELAAGREAEIARHLGECRECQAVLADLKRVSETLQRWQVEPAPASLRPPAVEDAEPQRRFSWRRLTWALAGTAVVVLVVGSLTIPNLLKSRQSADERVTGLSGPSAQTPERRPTAVAPPPASAPARAPLERDRRGDLQARQEEKFEAAPSKESSGEVGSVVGGVPGAVGMLKDESGRVADEAAPLEAGGAANRAVAKSALTPRMIAYWVTMTVEVKEFSPAKEKLLKAVEEAGGYVAQASAAETPNQPQRADLAVRVPVEKLPAVLEQIRGLGRVVNEQLSSEEVTAQVVDLEARLRNSRATEEIGRAHV